MDDGLSNGVDSIEILIQIEKVSGMLDMDYSACEQKVLSHAGRRGASAGNICRGIMIGHGYAMGITRLAQSISRIHRASVIPMRVPSVHLGRMPTHNFPIQSMNATKAFQGFSAVVSKLKLASVCDDTRPWKVQQRELWANKYPKKGRKR